MAKYVITYETFIEVEANSEAEAREKACGAEAEQELLANMQELDIEEI